MKKLILKFQRDTQNSVSCHLSEESLQSKANGFGIHPDGLRSYTVCLAALICNVIVIGYCYSFGVLLPPLLNHFKEDTATTAWVGSLYMSISFLLGPVAANLCDRYGCRSTTILGGVACTLGLLLTSQAPSIFCMYLTYSVIVGFGSCCVYTASVIVVPRYFLKRRSLAIGVVTCGPAAGTLVMGPLLQFLLDALGCMNTFIAMAGMASVICVLALVYDPRTAKEISASEGLINITQHRISEKQSSWMTDIFTNKALVILSVSVAVVSLGLYNPQVLLVKYAEQQGVSPDESSMFFCYMGLTSAVVRILTGHLCDFKWVNVRVLCQTALYINGAAICLLSRADSYYRLLAYSVVSGFCDGLFASTFNVQIIGSVKSHLTSKAIGFYLGVTSPSLAAGPPIAGFVADKMNTFALAFYLSAIAVFFGATLSFTLYCLNERKSANILEEMSLSSEEHLMERETVV